MKTYEETHCDQCFFGVLDADVSVSRFAFVGIGNVNGDLHVLNTVFDDG
jgi:hypothetical protein